MANCGELTVRAQFDRSNVMVHTCSGLPSTANAGDTVTINVTVRNRNPNDAVGSVVVKTESGQTLASSDRKRIPAEGRTQVPVEFQVPESDGNYTIVAEATGVTRPGETRGLSAGNGRVR